MALRSTSALILLAGIIARTTAQQERNCWFPDGNTESPDIPCDPNAEESACCGPDAFCLSNGLCLVSGVVSRGSCTDRNWNDPACATQCTSEYTDRGIVLINCDATLGLWVCANGNTCGNDATLFPIDNNDMNQIAIRPSQNDSAPPLLLEPSSIVNNASSTDDGNSTVTVTVTATASPTSSDANARFTTGQMAGVGAGVGVPLLLCLLGAIFVIVQQRRHRKAAEAFGRGNEPRPTNHIQSQGAGLAPQMPYGGGGGYGPEQKAQHSAAYYRPISPSPSPGQFREMVPVNEMDGTRERSELEVPK